MKDILSFLDILKFHNFIKYFELTYKIDSNKEETFNVSFKVTENGSLHSFKGSSASLMKYIMLEIWKIYPKLTIKLNKERLEKINKFLKYNSDLYYKKGNNIFKILQSNDEGYFVKFYELANPYKPGTSSFIPFDLIDEVEIYFNNVKI